MVTAKTAAMSILQGQPCPVGLNAQQQDSMVHVDNFYGIGLGLGLAFTLCACSFSKPGSPAFPKDSVMFPVPFYTQVLYTTDDVHNCKVVTIDSN